MSSMHKEDARKRAAEGRLVDDRGRKHPLSLHSAFSNPGGIFTAQRTKLADIKAHCLVVLDTNIPSGYLRLGEEGYRPECPP